MGIIFVFIGGATGALFRYMILKIFGGYPYNIIGTFCVNLLGCFIIGFISYMALKRNHIIGTELKKFFTVGLTGGLTTFSAFSFYTLNLILNHHYMIGLLNLFSSVILGLIFVAWGMNTGYYLLNYLLHKKRLKFRQEKTF